MTARPIEEAGGEARKDAWASIGAAGAGAAADGEANSELELDSPSTFFEGVAEEFACVRRGDCFGMAGLRGRGDTTGTFVV